MAVKFSSSEQDVLNRTVETKSVQTPIDQLSYMYELDKCVSWITDNHYKQVSVQFGDAQLCDSVRAVQHLQQHTVANIYILADTSYGSCCADEVAAEHISADCLIHFGHSCGSATSRLPVLYIYTKQYIDTDLASSTIYDYINQEYSKSAANIHVIIEHDPVYNDAIVSIQETLIKNIAHVTVSHSSPCLCSSTPEDCVSATHIIIYVGSTRHTQAILACQLKYAGSKVCNHFLVYEREGNRVSEVTNSQQLLMRRFHMVERIRDASTIGILVGTLGVTDYLAVVERMKSVIRASGKKTYMFSVGKLNPAKLANFANIDLYVLVGCTETSLYPDAKQDYYRPLVTPYEVESALNQAREWRGDEYTLDFSHLLPGGAHYVPESTSTGVEVDVSLITGRIRQLGKPTASASSSGDASSDTDKQLVLADSDDSTNVGGWSGLEIQYGKGKVEAAVEGRTGTAMGYHNEGQ